MVSLFKRLKKKEIGFAIVSLVFIVIQVILDLQIPGLMKTMTEILQTTGTSVSQVLWIGAQMMLCALGSLLAAIFIGYLSSTIATSFSAQLRQDIFHKTLDFSIEDVGAFSIPSLITRTTNDITQVQMFIAVGLQVIVKAPIMATMATMKIVSQSWQWTLATGVAVVVLLLMMLVLILFVLPKFKITQKNTDSLNLVTRETLTGLRVVRSFNAEEYQEEKFEKVNDTLSKTNLFINRVMGVLTPGITFIMSGISLAIYWIGAYLIQGSADYATRIGLFGDMVAFSSYAMQVIMSFMMITVIFVLWPRASVSAERINDVLLRDPSIHDGKGNKDFNSHSGKIEFKNVTFGYTDAEENVLENITFTAEPGETVAFIGSTGAGKSTLINLIPRFHDVTQGEILVDGVDVREYTQKDLHDKLSYVSQKPVLFSGSIRSNVTYGLEQEELCKDENINRALDIAQASNFVEKLPDKIDSRVAQGGQNFSGGQKQRISIARAIARQPEIFLFDDSFSALDYETDRDLRKALMKNTAESTKLIVAQRIGTIQDADKIIVIDHGKIVGLGKHKELLQTCKVYQEIAQSQLTQQEIEEGM